MVNSYTAIFNQRGHSYNEATSFCPEARYVERQLLVDLLQPQAGDILLDVPAGGGYVAEGVAKDCEVICLEPAIEFGKNIANFPFVNGLMTAMPIKEGYFDCVASLAGMHHLENRQGFFNEAFRVLKTTGRLGVADVQENSPQAVFLNGAVDRLTLTGHQGDFFSQAEMIELMTIAGFKNVSVKLLQCPWAFASRQQMAQFCQKLFGLVKADVDQVLWEIESVLEVTEINGRVSMEWALLYAIGEK